MRNRPLGRERESRELLEASASSASVGVSGITTSGSGSARLPPALSPPRDPPLSDRRREPSAPAARDPFSPLPEGVSRAEITFRVGGGIRGTRVVRRSEAEFAHLRTAVDGVYEGPW
ncbi:hypothetical protein, partial [Nocardia wallacei]|uniref:hypothetical protein n=1 Tax=Nocardia wallacei TaxID=480035 RepID=UPI002454C60C